MEAQEPQEPMAPQKPPRRMPLEGSYEGEDLLLTFARDQAYVQFRGHLLVSISRVAANKVGEHHWELLQETVQELKKLQNECEWIQPGQPELKELAFRARKIVMTQAQAMKPCFFQGGSCS